MTKRAVWLVTGRVMLVEASGFHTDCAGRSADESKQEIADYAQTAGRRPPSRLRSA